jgi:diguanylate cyclase (GGDEF)-like protein/PAS domain S-box-containing protein
MEAMDHMAEPFDESSAEALRRLHEALAATEERLRAVVANAPIVLYSIDRAGVFTLSEGKGLEALGLQPGQVVGQSVYDLYVDNPEVIASVERGLAGETFTSVAEVAGLVYETYYGPLYDSAGVVTGIIGVATDVTEATRRERLLAETGRTLRVLVQSAPVPVASLDLDGRVQLWNPAAECTFGYGEQEVLGQPYPLIPDGKEEEFRQLLETVAVGGATLAGVELRRQKKDGSPIDISLSAAPLRGDGDAVVGVMAVLVDITEAKRAEQSLRESEAKYRAIFENIHDLFYQTELAGTIVELSPSVGRFGYTREQLIGTSVLSLYPDADERQAFVKAVTERGGVNDYELRLRRGDGTIAAASVSAVARRNADGAIVGFEGTIRDVSERKQFESQLVHVANHDPLTGLFNRRRFDEEVARHLLESQRYDLHGSLLFIDLDQFKDVNDSRGHSAGDELLSVLARLLRDQLRATDVAARLGGDEFAILLPHTDGDQAQAVAASLLDAIRGHTFVVGGAPLRITASIGIALFPDHAAAPGDLLSRADLAMYRAKDEGRNRACLYAPDGDWQAQIETRISWQQRVREAIENDRFALHAQPIMDLADGRTSQYELLLRLDRGDGEFVLPGQFLDVAERSGQIQEIDRWVVLRAIDLLAEHRAAATDIRLEVNLSGKAFADQELLRMIQQRLGDTGVDPARLILEVTETAAIANIDEAQRFVRTLQAMGCKFALDDFGVGFSSFSHLKHLPVDYLKIDGSFIRDLARNSVDQHLVQAIVGVARGLGKRTIAEFVGDDETLQLLRAYGVDFAQGYFIGHPAPLPDAAGIARRAA